MDFLFGLIVGAGAAGLVFMVLTVFRASKVDELEAKIRAEFEEKAAKLKEAETKLKRRVARG